MVRGFRGPGRLAPCVDVAGDGTAAVEAMGGGVGLLPFPLASSFTASFPFSQEGVDAEADAASNVGSGRGAHRGHFLASSESSGTSTMSLERR